MQFGINDFEPIKRKKKVVKTTPKIKKADEPITLGGIGEEMLKTFGWSEGKGAGKYEQGIEKPIEPNQTVERTGIGELGGEREKCVELKLKHYGKDATNQKIEEMIEIEDKMRSIEKRIMEELMNIQNLIQKEEKMIEKKANEAANEEERIEIKKEEIEINNKGKGLIEEIKEQLEGIIEVEDCFEMIYKISEWKKQSRFEKKEIMEFCIENVLKRGIDEMALKVKLWKKEKERFGPYFEFFQQLLSINDKQIKQIIQKKSDEINIKFFKELIAECQSNNQIIINYYNQNKGIVSDDAQNNMMNQMKQLVDRKLSLNEVIDLFAMDELRKDKHLEKQLNDIISNLIGNKKINEVKNVCLHSKSIQEYIFISIKYYIIQMIENGDIVGSLETMKEFEEILPKEVQLVIIELSLKKNNSLLVNIQPNQLKDLYLLYLKIRSFIKDEMINDLIEYQLRDFLTIIDSLI